MKIVVLNGSPKGEISVTLQYVKYIQHQFPDHEYVVHHISQRIKKLEHEEQAFQAIIDDVREADGVLWSFPLYHMLVPSQYKRFIELLWERGAVNAFTGKYAAVLTTSIHFYDHTAHNYMNAICDDLGMHYVDGFSAEMQDLLEERGRRQLTLFAQDFLDALATQSPTIRNYPPVSFRPIEYAPGSATRTVSTNGKKVLVVTDSEGPDTNLAKMVERFCASFSGEVEVINLHDVDIKGGCMGCMQCGYDNVCAYTGKDGFVEFHKNKVETADILVWAGTIKDRYLSSRWKTYFDRSFFNTHKPMLHNVQLAMIVSGPLGQNANLRQILEVYPDFGQANFVGVVTDEYGDSAQIDQLLQAFAEKLVTYAQTGYVKPRTFLGISALKLFRDEIYGGLRFPFVADHRYYKQHGLYDFPGKDLRRRLFADLMMALVKFPRMREDIYKKRLKMEVIKPYQRFLANV